MKNLDIFWMFFGLAMGVFLGGSVFFAVYFHPANLHGQKQEAHSAHTERPAEGEPRGSQASPFFVQVIPTPKSAEERAQETEDREEKKAAERDLVRWTLALFLATVGLIGATAVLGYFGFRQARDMKASIEIADKGAKAALRQANAMVALEAPIPSILQMKFVQYANANPNELFSVIDPVNPGPIPDFCRPLILVENLGRTRMYLVQMCIDWIVAPELPSDPPYTRIVQSRGALPGTQDAISGGEAVPNRIWYFNPELTIELSAKEREEIASARSYLWVFGYISYLNFAREGAAIGFMARWDVSRGFVRVPNPKYEYQT